MMAFRNVLVVSVAILLFPTERPALSKPRSRTSAPQRSALQLIFTLNHADVSQPGRPKFSVEFRNAGQNALILNLGTMLANGEKQFLDAVDLILTDPQGRVHRLIDSREPWAINGRLDPLVVPLCVGCNFSFPVDFNNYWPGDEQVMEAGTYSIEARFVGRGVSGEEANLDMKGIALMPYWLDTVTSNHLRFQISEQLRTPV
jgi:hypothetical protein